MRRRAPRQLSRCRGASLKPVALTVDDVTGWRGMRMTAMAGGSSTRQGTLEGVGAREGRGQSNNGGVAKMEVKDCRRADEEVTGSKSYATNHQESSPHVLVPAGRKLSSPLSEAVKAACGAGKRTACLERALEPAKHRALTAAARGCGTGRDASLELGAWVH
jgi:hypothetical protein